MGWLNQNRNLPMLKQLGGGSAPFVGPLDAYTADLQVAVLPFRGFTSYVGPWCRIRESIGDTEQDIGYLSDGQPDTSAWTTFVGAGDGFLRTWYDQSGGARDMAQATNANQPQSLLNTVNGYPVCRLDGVDDLLQSSGLSTSTVRTLYLVTRKRTPRDNLATRAAGGFGGTSRFLTDSAVSNANKFQWQATGVATISDIGGDVDLWSIAVIVVASAASATTHINNASPTTFDPANAVTTTTTNQIGSTTTCSDSDVVALMSFNTNHNDATREAIQTILANAFGITLAP